MSTDHPRRGLGIGLALVREIVGHHGGRVSAHSDGPALGSTFSVYLPLHCANAIGETVKAQDLLRDRADPSFCHATS